MGSSASLIPAERKRKLSFRSAMIALQELLPNVRFKASPALSEIDIELQRQRKEEQYMHKILLLGAGECGKSTVLKQVSRYGQIMISILGADLQLHQHDLLLTHSSYLYYSLPLALSPFYRLSF